LAGRTLRTTSAEWTLRRESLQGRETPFPISSNGGCEHGAALLASADKLERHAGLGLILDYIGEVVEDQQVKAVEPVDCGLGVEFVARDLELLDQVRRPGEENLPSRVCDLGLAELQILQDPIRITPLVARLQVKRWRRSWLGGDDAWFSRPF
jgi:hypothetical protein